MNKVIYYLVSGLWYLLSLLPFCIHYLFSDLVYLILYRMIGYRMKVVRQNLTTSFPEKGTLRYVTVTPPPRWRACSATS